MCQPERKASGYIQTDATVFAGGSIVLKYTKDTLLAYIAPLELFPYMNIITINEC